MELEELKKQWTAGVTASWCLQLRAGGPLTEVQVATVTNIAE